MVLSCTSLVSQSLLSIFKDQRVMTAVLLTTMPMESKANEGVATMVTYVSLIQLIVIVIVLAFKESAVALKNCGHEYNQLSLEGKVS